jgi:hypothetical protein
MGIKHNASAGEGGGRDKISSSEIHGGSDQDSRLPRNAASELQ